MDFSSRTVNGYPGRSFPTLEHRTRLIDGGTNIRENLAVSCRICNGLMNIIMTYMSSPLTDQRLGKICMWLKRMRLTMHVKRDGSFELRDKLTGVVVYRSKNDV